MLAAANHSLLGVSVKEDIEKKIEPLPPEFANDIDLQLMARVKAGDDEAFNTLMQRHEKTVVNLVYRFTGNREIAHDLAEAPRRQHQRIAAGQDHLPDFRMRADVI